MGLGVLLVFYSPLVFCLPPKFGLLMEARSPLKIGVPIRSEMFVRSWRLLTRVSMIFSYDDHHGDLRKER